MPTASTVTAPHPLVLVTGAPGTGRDTDLRAAARACGRAVIEVDARRLAFHVRFPMPDERERAELWRVMLPAAAPVADDVDFAVLGERMAMSGGYIRNAVLRAAFVAEARTPIHMTHLWHAGIAECEAIGRIAPAAARP